MKPILFLDIDGVINAVPSDKQLLLLAKDIPIQEIFQHDTWTEWRRFKIDERTPILYSPQLIKHLNKIGKKVDIAWNTSWGANAAKVFAPHVGLDIFPVLPFGGSDNHYQVGPNYDLRTANRWWKIGSVIRDLEKIGRDFIWLDDDITPVARKQTEELAAVKNVRSLVIRPDVTKGIQPFHIDSINTFIESL